VNTLGAYRGLKRLTTAATFLLFAVSLIVGYLYLDKATDLWAIAMWSGVCAPVAATLLILALLGLGWPAPGLGGSGAPRRLRTPAALWIFIGVQVPWILAWLGADAAGVWWQHLHAASQGTPYLGAVRLIAWLVSYALASALGVLATFYVDAHFTERRGANLK
jgi:hypothetical protein